MKLVYLVGPPGVGKTTLMEALTARCERQSEAKPFAHDWLYRDTTPVGIELGRRRETFSGTDALSMSVQPKAEYWMTLRRHPLILGEGARLATHGFLQAARAAGYKVSLVHMVATDETLEARRRLRGSNQKPSWIAGATTRARRIADQMKLDAAVHVMSAHGSTADLLSCLLALEPELKALTDD